MKNKFAFFFGKSYALSENRNLIVSMSGEQTPDSAPSRRDALLTNLQIIKELNQTFGLRSTPEERREYFLKKIRSLTKALIETNLLDQPKADHLIKEAECVSPESRIKFIQAGTKIFKEINVLRFTNPDQFNKAKRLGFFYFNDWTPLNELIGFGFDDQEGVAHLHLAPAYDLKAVMKNNLIKDAFQKLAQWANQNPQIKQSR